MPRASFSRRALATHARGQKRGARAGRGVPDESSLFILRLKNRPRFSRFLLALFLALISFDGNFAKKYLLTPGAGAR